MSEQPKREPGGGSGAGKSGDDAWDALEDMALADEAERVLGMTGKELDAELAAKGLDARAVRERAAAVAAEVAARSSNVAAPAAAASNVRKMRPSWRTRLAVLGVAATAATIAAALAAPGVDMVGRGRPAPSDTGDERSPPARADASAVEAGR